MNVVRRSLPLALALGLDVVVGEPPAAIHPVVGIGQLAAVMERRAPGGAWQRLVYGALSVGGIVSASVFAGDRVLRAMARAHPLPRLLILAWLLKTTFALRSLSLAAQAVQVALQRDDLDGARAALRSLVSRDVSRLGPALLAAAAIESVAENASDSLVAPLLYYMVGGLPSALAYRAINTLDAMWGYHGAYEHLGKTAARVDDLVNLAPARLTGLLMIGAAALCGRDAAGAWRVMWRDHGRTTSPNAGWPMAAMAGALGIELEKVEHYRVGAPAAPPSPAAIGQSVRLVYSVCALGAAACVLGEVAHRARHQRR